MAQSQTPPNTMIVVNSLPLKKKTKNTFFFQPPFEILTSFSSLFLVSCLCRCIHHYFCSLHTSHEGRSRVFAIHSCEWAEGRVKRRWIWSCACVCARARKDRCVFVTHCPLQSVRLFPCFHIQPARDYLSLIASLSSLFAPVPPSSHLFVSHAVLHRLCFLSFLVASSVSFLCFFQIWFLFSALSPLSVLDFHSSSVSSHLPENFTIALNDAWVSFDSLSSLHRNTDSSAFPEMIVQEYCVCLCASICIGNGVRNHNRWF